MQHSFITMNIKEKVYFDRILLNKSSETLELRFEIVVPQFVGINLEKPVEIFIVLFDSKGFANISRQENVLEVDEVVRKTSVGSV